MPTTIQLGIAGLLGALTSCYCLLPTKIAIFFIALFLILAGVVAFVASRWEEAAPNEWLLLLENGNLVKSGIGLKCFRWINQQVEKFSSSYVQVDFSAQNVTKEMSGVEIRGFCIFSPDRTLTLKYYQSMSAGGEYELKNKVQTMCESILRHQIANHSLNEVLRNRTKLRDNIKKDIQAQVKGWGIWVETVEITEVTISSGTLFKDMQAEFRNKMHLKASKVNSETNQIIKELRMNSELNITKLKSDNETETQRLSNEHGIKQDEEKAKYKTKQNEIEQKKNNDQKELEKLKQDKNFKINKDAQDKQTEVDNMNVNTDLLKKLKRLELDKKYEPEIMKKYEIDQTFKMYRSIPVKEVNINQYMAPEQTNSLTSMIPGIDKLVQREFEKKKN